MNVVVEGQAEEQFVNRVMAPEFHERQMFLFGRALQTGRRGGMVYRGGAVTYQRLRKELLRWLADDRSALRTTMIDLYRLADDFPGYQAAMKLNNPVDRALLLETEMAKDMQMPSFLPYIQVHEFEALLLAQPDKFSVEFPGQTANVERLRTAVALFPTPEFIDDGPETSSSKRIMREFPKFRKTVQGINIARRIGMEGLRGRCAHFHEWVAKLESHATPPGEQLHSSTR
ncbi:MAG: DUF4276 family protein [Bryobacterales bacterium]|nr:DUF4276 family protein [Bryobacterales bacterium]